MAEPSLAWTAASKSSMFEFMYEKVWYYFEDQTTLFDAWATYASSSGDATKAAQAIKFGGRTLTVLVSNAFVSGWPASPEYVTKWSGGCLRDESSGMGGFCLLETSSTDLTTAPSATAIFTGSVSSQTLISNTSRSMEIYRMSASDFSTFETAWTTQA